MNVPPSIAAPSGSGGRIGVIDVIGGIALSLVVGALTFLLYSRKHSRIWRDPLSADELTTMLGAARYGRSNDEDRPLSDTVEVTAFAPRIGREGEEIFVQIFLHKLEQTNSVAVFAEAIDPGTSIRGKTTLTTEITRGERIDVILEGPSNVMIDESHQYLVWRGESRSCQFVVSLPTGILEARRTLHFRVCLLLASIPVGDLRFPLLVSSFDESEVAEAISGTAHYNRHAFLSYATADRAEVLKRAQALKVAQIDFFQDLLSLEPGERWERRLYEEIDRCDLFLLFWSSHAAHSSWVAKETEYALDRQKKVGEQNMAIAPIILEGPPIAPVPEKLKDIHFDDAIRYVLAGIEAEKKASADDRGRSKGRRRRVSAKEVSESKKTDEKIRRYRNKLKDIIKDTLR
jgi:hypothetical protein